MQRYLFPNDITIIIIIIVVIVVVVVDENLFSENNKTIHWQCTLSVM
jgi:hypothetical protein